MKQGRFVVFIIIPYSCSNYSRLCVRSQEIIYPPLGLLPAPVATYKTRAPPKKITSEKTL